MDSNRYLKAFNIEWDVDLAEDLDSLPKEVQIPDGMTDTEEISDYLSNLTGFCHRGFELKEAYRYQVKLCYGYEQNEDGSIFHAFEAIGPDESPVEMSIDKKLCDVLEADEDNFDWDWLFVALPESIVSKIRSDALEDMMLAMAKASASHEEDKLVLLRNISSLADKLSAAESCIGEIETAIICGGDVICTRKAISKYRKRLSN